jgi:glycosyltransferase involved in cell wall biosynthesis
MPTWNGEQFLAETVESILSQTLADFEFLVVDGGSTDRTLEILACYKDPRLRVLQAPAAGIVSALNFGIEQARAPWIARQDADDISDPRRLESQWNAVQREPNAVLCHTNVHLIGKGVDTIGHARFPKTQALFALKLCYQCAAVHSTVMFKRETALAVGGYPQHQAEDYALWGRLIEKGFSVGLPQKLLQFRMHPVSASKRHLEAMVIAADRIGVDHCRRFMRLSDDDAARAHRVLREHGRSGVKDWFWFLQHCVPRLPWKSAELSAWLAWQTVKTLVSVP